MKKGFIEATPDSGSGNGSLNVTASRNYAAPRSTEITISGGGVSKTIPITQQGGKVSMTYSSGQLEGFDPTMPGYTSGPFKPIVPSAEVQILPKSQSGISINCIKLQLRPSLPVGDWVRGELTLTIGDVINARVDPSPFIGTGAPNGINVSMTGPNDVIVNYFGTVGPSDNIFTQYWWIPVTADGQQGFVLDVL